MPQESFLQRMQRLREGAPQTAPGLQSPAYPNDPSRGRGFVPPSNQPAPPQPPKQVGQGTVRPMPQQPGPTAATGANQPPPGAAAAPPTYYSLNQYQDSLQQRYGRRATNEELNGALSQGVGAAGPNGYTAAQWNIAQRNAENLARSQGWNGPAYQPVSEGGPAAGPAPGEVGHQGRVALDPGAVVAAETGQVNPMAIQLMEQILANPESLGANTVAQMKARGKESALAMADQLKGAAGNAVAGRGFSANGGMQAGTNREIDSQLIADILGSNRDIDIGAASQNFNDRLSALGAASGFMNDSESRAGMLDDRRIRDAQFRYGQMADDRNSNLQEFLGREGVRLDRDRLNETTRQFDQTYGLDLRRFLESIRQFDSSLGENARQANNSLGFNYTQLGQQGQNGLMNWLSSIYNGNR